MILRAVLIGLFFCVGLNTMAQDTFYKFWVQLTDKKLNDYSINNPEEFLSQRALERRSRHGIQVSDQDLPVSSAYLDSLDTHPLTILYTSKWMNAVVIRTQDSSLAITLPDLSFVSGVQYLYRSNLIKKSSLNKWGESSESEELHSDHQIEMLNGQVLHQSGYEGQGMVIAVLDGGFSNADTLSGLDSLFSTGRIIGTRSFVEPDSSFYVGFNGSHGTSVLSIMGGDVPGHFRGTAPKASYFLMQTEDTRSEFRVEEANWLAGAELADSIGADVINTSLGYSVGFTDEQQNYKYSDMDGNTTLVTRAAQLAATKGILVVTSAGNSGRPTDQWGYINSPADGDSLLAIGAVDAFGIRAHFSSKGPSSDGRVKPDVMALGLQTWLIRSSGLVSQGSGTSFSSPVMAGLATCLWQKNPEISNYRLIETIRSSASLNPFPDSLYGYGIPNFSLANDIITVDELTTAATDELILYPNPAREYIALTGDGRIAGKVRYEIVNIGGRSFLRGELNLSPGERILIPLQSLPGGSYVMLITSGKQVQRGMFIKL
ncbi:S8 family serine peptidase [Bacteroidota bacterium]